MFNEICFILGYHGPDTKHEDHGSQRREMD